MSFTVVKARWTTDDFTTLSQKIYDLLMDNLSARENEALGYVLASMGITIAINRGYTKDDLVKLIDASKACRDDLIIKKALGEDEPEKTPGSGN